jgi:hypothetical protein
MSATGSADNNTNGNHWGDCDSRFGSTPTGSANVAEWWLVDRQLTANHDMKAAVAGVDFDLTTNPKNHVFVHSIKAAGFVGHLGPELSLYERFTGLLPRGGDDKHVFGVRWAGRSRCGH